LAVATRLFIRWCMLGLRRTARAAARAAPGEPAPAPPPVPPPVPPPHPSADALAELRCTIKCCGSAISGARCPFVMLRWRPGAKGRNPAPPAPPAPANAKWSERSGALHW
jgi:hypothetical protein